MGARQHAPRPGGRRRVGAEAGRRRAALTPLRAPLPALLGLAAGLVLAVGPTAYVLLGTATAPPAPPAPAAPARQVAPAVLHDAPPLPPTAPAPAPGPAPPVHVRVADAGVDAPVVESGVDPKGGMAVPHDVSAVGWYRFGAGPGAAAGSAVLAGHVDDKVQGYGAFHRLAAVVPGSRVEVTLADGTVVGYRVSTVERVAKAALPADQVFARDGPPRLALVTCGGAFDRAAGGYTDNVVVTAAPDGTRR